VEGKNVIIERRVAEGQYDRLPALVADLISRQVAGIVADGSIGSALAARAATATTPIVFMIGADPVRTGLVASLNRPGGNVTGITTITGIIRKQLKMLRKLVPTARAFAMLVNPGNPTHSVDKDSEADVHGIVYPQTFNRRIKGSAPAGLLEGLAKARSISEVQIDPSLVCGAAVCSIAGNYSVL
jgi:hypothetical protein